MDGFVTLVPSVLNTGLTVGIKDSIDMAGLVTGLGSRITEGDAVARVDADVVRYLREAGFCIYGKTMMHELAFGMTGVNEYSGTPMNPIYPDFIPGGSSSGSATAVANNTVDIALGTDTGGSVRLPAACCGVYGLKPSFARVSRKGVWPPESSLDCVGIFAKKPDYLTRAFAAIDPSFKEEKVGGEITFAWIDVEAEPCIIEAIKKYLASLENTTLQQSCTISLPLMPDAFMASMTIIAYETLNACRSYIGLGKLGGDVEKRLKRAESITSADVAAAEKIREAFTHQVDQALKRVSILVMPTLPSFPLKRAQAIAGTNDLAISSLVRPFNLSGHPAVTVPLYSDINKPIAIQLIGKKGDEALLCAITEKYFNFSNHSFIHLGSL